MKSVGLDGEWKVAPLRRDMVVLTAGVDDEGVIADDVVFVVRRGLVEAILTGQVFGHSMCDIWRELGCRISPAVNADFRGLW